MAVKPFFLIHILGHVQVLVGLEPGINCAAQCIIDSICVHLVCALCVHTRDMIPVTNQWSHLIDDPLIKECTSLFVCISSSNNNVKSSKSRPGDRQGVIPRLSVLSYSVMWWLGESLYWLIGLWKTQKVNSQLYVVSDCSLAPIICKSLTLQQSFHNIYVVSYFTDYFVTEPFFSDVRSIFPTNKTIPFFIIFMLFVNVLDPSLCAVSGWRGTDLRAMRFLEENKRCDLSMNISTSRQLLIWLWKHKPDFHL